LLQPRPADRVPVSEAIAELQRLSLHLDVRILKETKNKLMVELQEIKSNTIMAPALWDKFIAQQTEIVSKSNSPDEVKQILQKLKDIKGVQLALKDIYQDMKAIHHQKIDQYNAFNQFMQKHEQLIFDAKTPEDLKTIRKNLELMRPEINANELWVRDINKPDAMRAILQSQQSNFLINIGPDNMPDMRNTLESIKNDYLACERLLKSIQAGSFRGDQKMGEFLQKTTQDIGNATTLEHIKKIKEKLEKIVNDPQTNAVREIIQNFRDNDTWYTMGMGAKADRINDAMSRVPVEDRGNILRGSSEEAKNVRKALASHRHFWRSDVYLDANNEVDATQAATSFRDFKDRFSTVKNPVVEDAENVRSPKFH
jgi:hypothetical protein